MAVAGETLSSACRRDKIRARRRTQSRAGGGGGTRAHCAERDERRRRRRVCAFNVCVCVSSGRYATTCFIFSDQRAPAARALSRRWRAFTTARQRDSRSQRAFDFKSNATRLFLPKIATLGLAIIIFRTGRLQKCNGLVLICRGRGWAGLQSLYSTFFSMSIILF